MTTSLLFLLEDQPLGDDTVVAAVLVEVWHSQLHSATPVGAPHSHSVSVRRAKGGGGAFENPGSPKTPRMASRDGPMVTGTDGTDFVHRETVATHYQISTSEEENAGAEITSSVDPEAEAGTSDAAAETAGSAPEVVPEDAAANVEDIADASVTTGSACEMPFPNYAEILRTLNYNFPGWPPTRKLSEVALNKGRLRKCVFAHLLLALLMVVKMVPHILDRLDIFVLEIEELEVPEPLIWEYVWLGGSLSSFLGLTAIRKNRTLLLQVYFMLINLLSTVPVLLASMIYFSDFYEYCTEDEPQDLPLWQGYPLAVLWYSFLLLAMQVHIFTLIFAWKLIIAWKNSMTSKKAQ
ncbi:protein jagunal homolog 1 [Palaemon carinicauda]|uniref:protein jagunal homolog 1 n=1 Tax=Palaemon carinicauda TaxID=392227 RepID=UPI0035B6AB95